MPLNRIPYQPLAFGIKRPTDCFNCNPLPYAMPMIPSDFLRAQFQQTPCNPSVVCDGDFTSVTVGTEVIPDGTFSELGAENIINGTFTGSATAWTLGTGWTYGANKVTKAAGNTNTLFQPIGFLPKGIYKVVFTISGYAAGTLTPRLVPPSVTPAFNGTAVSADGTYTQYIKATDDITQLDLVPNSAFIGSVDDVSVRRIAATWQFGNETDPAGWVMNTNGNPENDTAAVSLTCPGVVAPLTTYTLVIEILDGVGDFSAWVGGTNTSHDVLPGGPYTFTKTVTSGAGTDISIIQSSLTTNTIIESVSLIEVDGECWDYSDDFVAISGGLCHTPGTVGTVENSAVISSGVYYQLKFTISGRTAGSIGGILAGLQMQVLPYDTNGTFVAYKFTTATGTLQFVTSSDFDGCISDVELFELKTDFLCKLYDTTDTLVANLESFLTYNDDFVTLNAAMSGDKGIKDLSNNPLPYGCYYVRVDDQCELQYEELVKDGDFGTAVGLYTNSVWSYNTPGGGAGSSIQTVGSQLVFTRGTDGFSSLTQSVWNQTFGYNNLQHEPTIASGTHNYRVRFDIIANSDTTNQAVVVEIAGVFNNTKKTVGSHTFDLLNVDPTAFVPYYVDIYIKVGAYYTTSATGTITIDNLSIRRIEPYDATYISELIKYGESFECTSLIQGYADANQMGFMFYSNGVEVFKLQQRIYVRAINPSYPEDTDDYLFSEGTQQRNFSQSKKSFLVITDALPEWTHDCLRLQRGLQYFRIGDDVNSMEEFISVPGDYTPEWLKNGDSNVGPVRFDVQIKNEDVKFYRNS